MTMADGDSLPRTAAWWRSTFAALSVRNYRLFFIGHGLSLAGTWMRQTALGWLVYQMTDSEALLGLILGLALLPLFVFSPLAGALADRVDKKRLILWTQILACGVSAAVALLIWMGRIEVWSLMALAILGGVAFAFEAPARQSFVFEMVGREKLMNAIALNSALVNAARTIGPALAGFVMAAVGTAMCFALDALSYLIVVFTLLAMRLPPFQPPAKRISRLEALLGGWREAARNKRVRVTLVLMVFAVACGWGFQSLLPALARDTLGLAEFGYGALMSMFGVGAILGALFVASRPEERNHRGQVFGGLAFLTAGMLMLSFSSMAWQMGAALLIAGFGGVMFLSTGNTIVQTAVDDGIRGRVMGIWSLGFGGAMPFGSFAAGALAEAYSPFVTIQIMGAMVGAAALLIFLSLERGRRRRRASATQAPGESAP